jgi:hypothetical protein
MGRGGQIVRELLSHYDNDPIHTLRVLLNFGEILRQRFTLGSHTAGYLLELSVGLACKYRPIVATDG